MGRMVEKWKVEMAKEDSGRIGGLRLPIRNGIPQGMPPAVRCRTHRAACRIVEQLAGRIALLIARLMIFRAFCGIVY